MIDVSFHVRLDRAAIHTNDFTWWQDTIALDTDTRVMTWPEVYEFIARSWIAGGDYATYVRTSGVDVERTDDGPDLGTDVKAPDTLQAYDGMPAAGNVAQVWATDTGGWPDDTD